MIVSSDPSKTGDSNKSVELVGENGCLSSVLSMLKEFKDSKKSNESLHLALVNFILNLWFHQRLIAMAHLKQQSNFWEDLTFPLFRGISENKTELNGMLLHLISLEIFTFKGQVDDGLRKILERFCDGKEEYFKSWCSHVLQQILQPEPQSSSTSEQYVLSDLFGSWKTFMVVLTRDQPVNLSPSLCQHVAQSLIESIRYQKLLS
jgi:hypothetical protein